MENSNFNQLLQRYLRGETTAQETAKIEAWLDVLKTQNSKELEFTKDEEEQLFQRIINASSNDSITSSNKILLSKTKRVGWPLQIAASLLILMAASFLVWTVISKPSAQQIVTSTNGVKKVILNDGTLVWLRNQGKLTYFQNKEGIRQATLQGNALFEVAKDPAHPFVITYGNVTLTVLGTSFSVEQRNDSVQLIVLTGKVNMSDSHNINLNVLPNQKVVYAQGLIDVQPTLQSEVTGITLNTEYNMVFADTPLNQVAAKISTKFNVEVNVESKSVGNCKITADFTDNSLNSTLQMISEVLNVTYTRKDNKVTISGIGCN
jgi:transmembrane sensor